MRILYCNKYNFPFSGTEAYLFEVMDLMRSRGHEVALFSMADPRGQPTAYDQHFVPHLDFKKAASNPLSQIKHAAHAIYSRDAQLRLRRMIAEFRPDVAHVRNIYHHLSPSVLWELKANGIPVLYHLNDFKLLCPNYNLVAHGEVCERCRGNQFWHVIAQNCYEGPRGSALVLAAEAYVHHGIQTYQKCVDRFLAPSRFVKDKLVENGWDRTKIDVLPHFQKLPPEPPAIRSNAPILYFGRLSAEKGVADLLRAMQQLPQVQLRIAGDGPQRDALQTLAKQLDMHNVQFLGHVGAGELDSLIASARFTILPSRAYETLGKSILESYAWGRPVIASDLGSRRELIAEGETGLLYEPGNVGQLTSAIRFLDERTALVTQMGAAGRARVRAHHAPETHYLALTLLYERMATQATPTVGAKPVVQKPSGLRVAFIGGRGVVSKYSGIETYYEEVGSRLSEMGHTVTAYCRPHFTPKTKSYAGMQIVRIPTLRTKHLETALHTLLSTLHVSFSRCEIVHYHALGPALFSFVPRWFGKKTVVTVQGLDWQRKKWGKLASFVLKLGEQAAIRLPDATMTVSRTLQQHYREQHAAETVYVPNGTRIREQRPPSRLAEWGLQPGNYILFTGRFSPEKNCHLLIEAYSRLKTSAKLVFAGGSSYSDPYVKKMHDCKNDNIVFPGWVSGHSLDELLTHAMLFVLPSDLEGLSLALLDAMGAGVCVLTSDIPENLEVVNGAGFTFHAGDVDDLERKLRTLIADSHLRDVATQSALHRIKQQYLWPGIAKQVEHVYLELAGRRKPVVPMPILETLPAAESEIPRAA